MMRIRIVTPDVNNNNVLRNGIFHGSNTVIPTGGHIEPISIAGDKLSENTPKRMQKRTSFRHNKQEHA